MGVYRRTEMDNIRELEGYIFTDSQLNYQLDVRLPYSDPSALFDGAEESVWDVRTWHNIATGAVATRDYNYLLMLEAIYPGFYLKPEVDRWLKTPNGNSPDQRLEDFKHVVINRERRGR